MRPRRLSRALRRGAGSTVAAVVTVLVMMVVRRTAHCSTYRVARSGWAGDVTGGLPRTFPMRSCFSVKCCQ